MAKLVVNFEETVVGHYFLDKERFTIGRKSDNDLFLDDPSVSSLHAAIMTFSNDHVLEDLASTNGVLVNGKKITRCILQNNDVVELSGYQLKYINQRATSDMDFDKTMIMEAAWTEAEELQAPTTGHGQPRLATTVSSARSLKTSFPLGGVKSLEGLEEEIWINAPLKTFGPLGGPVFMISRRPQGYYVTHVEGKKFPKVNGKSIGDHPVLLKEDDVIEAGGVKLKFFMQREDLDSR